MITIPQPHGKMNGRTDDFAVAIPRSVVKNGCTYLID